MRPQLDTDPAKETALIRTTRCSSYGICRQVVVRDGRRTAVLTPPRVPSSGYEATAGARAVDVLANGRK